MSTDESSLMGTSGQRAPDDELRGVWQEVPATAASLSDAVLDARASHVARAHRRLRMLRVAQLVGAPLGVIMTADAVLRATDPLMRAGAAVLGIVFVLRWVSVRRAARVAEVARSAGPIVSVEPSIVAYRAALLERLDEDRGPRLWWRLAVGAPAIALFLYGFARANPALRPMIALEAVAVAAGLSITFALTVRRARRYQAELDAIDALATPDEARR